MTTLKFSEEDHRYTLDGEDIPSVSEVVRMVHTMPPDIPPHVLELSALRGTQAAAAVRLYLEDDLDEDDLDESLVPRIGAFKKWFSSAKFVPDIARCEAPTYATFGGQPYGLTPDLVGVLDGWPYVIEIKCTYKKWEPHHGIQLAGYANWLAGRDNIPFMDVGRMVLNLGKDGEAATHMFGGPRDLRVFGGALDCVWWMRDQAKPKRKKKSS